MPVAVRDGEKRGTEPAEIARPAASWLIPGGVHHRNDDGCAGWEGNCWDRGWQIIRVLLALLPALLRARTPRNGEEHRKH